MSEYAHRDQTSGRYVNEKKGAKNNQSGEFDWEKLPYYWGKKSKFLPINKPSGNIRDGLRLNIDGDGDQQSHELKLEFFGEKSKLDPQKNTISVRVIHEPSKEVEIVSFETDIALEQFYIWHQEVTDGRIPYKLYLQINSRKLENIRQQKNIPKEMLKRFEQEHINDPGVSANVSGYRSPITLDEVEGDKIFKVTPNISADHQQLTYTFAFDDKPLAKSLTVPYAGLVTDPKNALIKLNEPKNEGKTAQNTNPDNQHKDDQNQGSVATFNIPIKVGQFDDEYALKIIPASTPGKGYLWVKAHLEGTPITWTAPHAIDLPWKKGVKTPYQVVPYRQYLAIYFGQKSGTPSGTPHLKVYQQSQSEEEQSEGTQTYYVGRSTVLHIYTGKDQHYQFPAYFRDGKFQERDNYRFSRYITAQNIKDYAWADASDKIPLLRGKANLGKDLDMLLLQDEVFLRKVLLLPHSSRENSPVALLAAYMSLRKWLQHLAVYQRVIQQSKTENDLMPEALTPLYKAREAARVFVEESRKYRLFTRFHINSNTLPARLQEQWQKLNYKQEWITVHMEMLHLAKYLKATYVHDNEKLSDEEKQQQLKGVEAEGTLREKLSEQRKKLPEGTFKVPVIFYPDKSNVSRAGTEGTPEGKTAEDLKGIPIPIYCYKKLHTWYALSFVNHKKKEPYIARYTLKPQEQFEYSHHPPRALFKDLDSKDHLPPGWLYYEIPGRPQDTEPLRIESSPNFEDYTSWLAVALLVGGISALTLGLGTGGALFLGAGILGGAGAVAKLYRKSANNTLGSQEAFLAWLDVAGAMLSILQFGRVGAIIGRAANASRTANIATQLKPLDANLWYMTIKGADFLTDTAMVIGGGLEMWTQIQQVGESELSASEKQQAIALIIGSFAVQAGMFVTTFGARTKGLQEAFDPKKLIPVKEIKKIKLKFGKQKTPKEKTPDLQAFKAKKYLEGDLLDAFGAQIGSKNLEKLILKLKSIKPEEWIALKKLYPEDDLLRALHFFQGDVAKARQYLRKQMGYSIADEQRYFQSFARYETLNHAGIKATKKSLKTEQTNLENKQSQQKTEQGLADTANKNLDATKSDILQKNQEIKQHKQTVLDKEGTIGQNKSLDEALTTEQQNRVTKYGIKQEAVPQESDPIRLQEILNDYQPHFIKQLTDLKAKKRQQELQIARDEETLRELTKDFKDFKGDLKGVIKDVNEGILKKKTADITRAYKKRLKRKKIVSKAEFDQIKAKYDRKYRKKERKGAAMAKEWHDKQVKERDKILKDFEKDLAKKQGELKFTKEKIGGTNEYYSVFEQQALLRQRTLRLQADVARLNGRIKQLHSIEIPGLVGRKTDLGQQVAKHQAKANQLEGEIAKAQKKLRQNQREFAPHLQRYQQALRHYEASSGQVGRQRHTLNYRHKERLLVEILQHSHQTLWQKIQAQVYQNPALFKSFWKLAKGVRGVTMQMAKTGALPPHLSDWKTLQTIEQRMQNYVLSQKKEWAAYLNTDVITEVQALEKHVAAFLQSPEAKKSAVLTSWLKQHQQTLQALQALEKTKKK